MTLPDIEVFGGDGGGPGEYFARLRDSEGGFLKPLIDDPTVLAAWQNRLTGLGTVLAVLDTGVWLEHPTIAAALTDCVDFTGQGPNDEHGHGTAVALIA